MKRLFAILSLLVAFDAGVHAADAPAYPGGEEALKAYLAENIKYPAMAKENGIEGIVNVAFTVKADGTIGAIKIVRMIDPNLEQEAIRLVKNMPNWIPADNNGAPVDATATVQVPFLLSE